MKRFLLVFLDISQFLFYTYGYLPYGYPPSFVFTHTEEEILARHLREVNKLYVLVSEYEKKC